MQIGWVITNDVLASLVGDAWSHAFTTLNIMAGFKKCPFNPGEIFRSSSSSFKSCQSVFSSEKQCLFQKCYEEEYHLNTEEQKMKQSLRKEQGRRINLKLFSGRAWPVVRWCWLQNWQPPVQVVALYLMKIRICCGMTWNVLMHPLMIFQSYSCV